MIKNKLFQIIFKTIYVVLGFIGVIGSLGYFSAKFNGNFYIYYTNLSNYICLGFMIASLVETIKSFKSSQEEFCNTAPKFKFMCMIMILVTCLVYNILLAKENTASEYFLSLSNLTNHLILPIMFVVDWILFYEHEQTKWYYPLLSTIMPLIYVVLIVIRALILGNNSGKLLYPYFFLDINTLGFGGFIMWVSILVVIFVALGYLLYFFDNIKNIRQKISSNKDKSKKN